MYAVLYRSAAKCIHTGFDLQIRVQNLQPPSKFRRILFFLLEKQKGLT